VVHLHGRSKAATARKPREADLGPCFEEFPGEGGWRPRPIGQFQYLSNGVGVSRIEMLAPVGGGGNRDAICEE